MIDQMAAEASQRLSERLASFEPRRGGKLISFHALRDEAAKAKKWDGSLIVRSRSGELMSATFYVADTLHGMENFVQTVKIVDQAGNSLVDWANDGRRREYQQIFQMLKANSNYVLRQHGVIRKVRMPSWLIWLIWR